MVCVRPIEATVPGRICPCLASFFLNQYGVCHHCDPKCAECFGPTSSDCFTCSANSYFSATEYVICDPSCSVCFGTTDQHCTACPSNRYLIGNTCTPPLVYNPLATPACSYPCQSNQFLFPDSFCQTHAIALSSQLSNTLNIFVSHHVQLAMYIGMVPVTFFAHHHSSQYLLTTS